MLNIVLDNIIFNLQKSGGISVVWRELLKRFCMNQNLNVNFLEYTNANFTVPKQWLSSRVHVLRKCSILLRVRRYLNPRVRMNEDFIFHSSYYRTSSSRFAINITTVHDFTYEYFGCGLKRKIHCWQKHRAIRNSDYIICISENTKFDLLKFLPDINVERITVVYNGVSDDYFVIKDKDINDFKLPFKRKTFVLFVGARSGYKNFELAVNALVNSSLNLVVVGEPLTKQENALLENKLGKERYKYVGRVSNSELNFLYNNAYCLLYPSAYEGFGIPVLEAQKAGCPVIAYDCSSIPEIIGKTPLLMKKLSVSEIGRGIELLRDQDIRENIINQGLENVKRFTWDRTYEQTYAIYQNALNSKA